MDDRDCVVFDIDDTLFLERDYVRSGFVAVGAWAQRELGIEGFGDRAWADFEAGGRATVFDRALCAYDREPSLEVISHMVTCYRSHQPAVELLADARECLNRLRGRCHLAVITDGPVESQRAKARALGVGAWADMVVFTGELGAGFSKPHCRAFEMVQERLGCIAARCTYLADNPAKDFAGPRSLGWTTVRVRRPDSLHHGVPSGDDVDLEIHDLSGFPAGVGTTSPSHRH